MFDRILMRCRGSEFIALTKCSLLQAFFYSEPAKIAFQLPKEVVHVFRLFFKKYNWLLHVRSKMYTAAPYVFS
jgi:hypothetical protein